MELLNVFRVGKVLGDVFGIWLELNIFKAFSLSPSPSCDLQITLLVLPTIDQEPFTNHFLWWFTNQPARRAAFKESFFDY